MVLMEMDKNVDLSLQTRSHLGLWASMGETGVEQITPSSFPASHALHAIKVEPFH